MSDYAYTPNTGKLKEFMTKIREAAVPTNGATQDWFQAFGFTSSNDRPILSVMRLIGFIDAKSKPTELWKQYRTPNGRRVLAEGIISGYKELFEMYPAAYNCSDKDLEAFFTKNSTAGKQVIDKKIRTFKTLCELADFNSDSDSQKADSSSVETIEENSLPKNNVKTYTKSNGSGITINVNIQLTLPDTTDPNVYEHFFEAMKKYILE